MTQTSAPRSPARAARRAILISTLICLGIAESAVAQEGLAVDLPVVGRTSSQVTSTTLVRYRGQNYDSNVKWQPMATQAIDTVPGAADAVEVRWRSPSATASVTNRTFSLVRLE